MKIYFNKSFYMPVYAKQEQLRTVMETLLFILNKLVTLGITGNHPNQ